MATLSCGVHGNSDDESKAFLSLWWHGAHDNGEGEDREIGCGQEIFKKVGLDQAEVYFCSTACLRDFLNACVDKLEDKIEECKEE